MKSNSGSKSSSAAKPKKANKVASEHAVGKTVAGGATGAVVGAMMGGPVGALLGGLVGTAIGGVAGGAVEISTAPKAKITELKTKSRSKRLLKTEAGPKKSASNPTTKSLRSKSTKKSSHRTASKLMAEGKKGRKSRK